MWCRIHDKPEVFALLSRIKDFLACEAFLELCMGTTDFAVDDVILCGEDGRDGTIYDVFSKVVNSACDLSNL